jgi:hypothetical protein
MIRRGRRRLAFLLCALCGVVPSVLTPTPPAVAADADLEARVNGWIDALSSGWTPNRGQLAREDGTPADDVLYIAQTPESRVLITRQGLTHLFTERMRDAEQGATGANGEPLRFHERARARIGKVRRFETARLDVSLVGATIRPERARPIDGFDAPGVTNYYLGHRPEGVLGVPTHTGVTFEGVYPGIDWVVRGSAAHGVHHDFVVAAGADPSIIRLRYDGATALELSADGRTLIARTPLGEVREGTLFCYQGDRATPVAARFELHGAEVRVRMGDYDRSRPLVIDPPLTWATYYGGTSFDGPRTILCDDARGLVYVVGYSGSLDMPLLDPPDSNYYQTSMTGTRDGFIWKFSQSGTRLWATYFGGNGDDIVEDAAIDAATGRLYVSGLSSSTNLPLQFLSGAFFDNTMNGPWDGYVARFGAVGNLEWSTHLGGAGEDDAVGITIDPTGRIYVCGNTSSGDFPLLNPGGGAYFQGVLASTVDAFVASFTPACALEWSTYYGGAGGDDFANGVITDGPRLYVTGTTNSAFFPLQNPGGGAYFQSTLLGGQDAFIARFTPLGVLQWSTYYGGTGVDTGDEPALVPGGGGYLYGYGGSTDMPTADPGGGAYYQPGNAGGLDFFLARFDGADSLTWGTYIGGNSVDGLAGPWGKPITTDAAGRVVLTGTTESTNFPVFDPGNNAYYLASSNGSRDAVLMQFAPSGVLSWSTYWSSAAVDFGTSVDMNGDGCIFATGESLEDGGMVTLNPGFGAWIDSTQNGDDDGYIAKFCAPSSACCLDFTCIPVSSAAECSLLGGTLFTAGQSCSTVVCTIDCTICGTKFNDLNRDGVKQGGEPGLSGWTIQLRYPGGSVYATTVTDSLGNYCFTGVPCGNWLVTEVHQPGWVPTTPTGAGHSLTTTTGSTTNGVDFGNFPCAPAPQPCVSAPPGLVAWWPFGDAPSAPAALDVAHADPPYNGALLFGAAGGVSDQLCLTTAADYALVPAAAQIDLDFGTGPFALMTWLNLEPAGAGARMVADHRVPDASSGAPEARGWALWIDGGQAHLALGVGSATQVVAGPMLPTGTWTHLAVSVDRDSLLGRWYLDGDHEPSFDFVPVAGNLSSGGDLRFGQSNPDFGPPTAFAGCLADVALFDQPVSGDAARKAFLPGPSVVFCPEYALLPSVVSLCPDQTTAQVCFKLANFTGTPQTYTWSLAPLAAGPGCTVAGPTVMTPSTGSITVPAGTVSASICVTIDRPPGMTAHNATSCFQLTWINTGTGVCRTKTAKLRSNTGCYCVPNAASNVVGAAARLLGGTLISLPVEVPCDPIARAYRWSTVWLDDEHDDPAALSLNGLPPGTPVIGTLTAPAGGSQHLAVTLGYPDGYDVTALYEVVLELDTDGDGQLERVATTVVHPVSSAGTSSVDPPAPVTPPAEAPRVPALRTSPNPFTTRTAILVTLPAPGPVELGIYDIAGRLVRRVAHGPLGPGDHRFEWDGRNDAAQIVASGVYFVRLRAGHQRVDGKIVKAD